MRNCLTILFLFIIGSCLGQETEYDYLTSGNEFYKDKAYSLSQKKYEQAVSVNGGSYEANFNLGNAYYKQDSLERAVEQFQTASSLATDKQQEANAYHNLGNALLQQEKYAESIDAYKEALRRNPADDDTRYNLAYAKEKLQEQKQKQKEQNQDNNENQDKKDDKNQDQQQKGDQEKDDKGDQEKKDQPGDEGDKKDQEGQQPEENEKNQDPGEQQQGQEGKMSKEQAERLLNAMEQEEEELRKRIKLKEENTEPKYIEKDW